MTARRAACAALALTTVAGCFTGEGSGQLAFQTYPAEGFSDVVLVGAGRATILRGAPDEFRVAASAESDVLPDVQVERDGQRLILRRDVDWLDGVRPTIPLHYRVVMPHVAAVVASGSGSLRVRQVAAAGVLRLSVAGSGAIDATDVAVERLTIEIEGAGEVAVSGVRTAELKVRISGTGRVRADGTAEKTTVDIMGAGVYRASGLRCQTAAATVTGSGQALLWVDERLQARINGAGRIAYLHDSARKAPLVERSVQGEGRVVAES